MAIAEGESVEEVDEVDAGLEELIEQKIENEVERRVAEETAELRQEYEAKLAERDERIDQLESKLELSNEDVWTLEDVVYGDDDTGYSPNLAKENAEENGGLLDRVEDLEANTPEAEQVDELVDRVDDAEKFIDQYGEGEEADQDEAWYKVVQSARNLHGNPNHTTDDGDSVVLYVDNIDQEVSYTTRHCSNLIETWGEEKKGVTWKQYKPKSAGENNEERRKRLVIDMTVWGDDE